MKQSLTIIFLFILVTTSLRAQVNKFDLGFEGGPNVCKIKGNKVPFLKYESIIYGSFALTFQYNLPKLFSVRAAIGYERKGHQMEIQVTDENGTFIDNSIFQSQFNYITLPILARFSFGKNIKFFLNAGAYGGFLFKEVDRIAETEHFKAINQTNTKNFKQFDYGLTGGFGLSVPIKTRWNVSLELRNNFGLVNISSLPLSNNGQVITNTTNILMGVSYKLGLRKKRSN
ncbi:porin family protein [Fluviicola taffensis]|uniref:Outer membrane protein beta-barrel domain-containing protein n=1 Tax=Fluviicola taffensis (strain DSM 16823 / NCIMB 13979 / RW262) TaxID=755732 RepID=F2IFA2_FLUTR|nr:porin family protein [Fluviicola taffensis]AEA44587.1 hypothetical protein Fluta_2603 [Fluviicola taffensis DSM 16823]